MKQKPYTLVALACGLCACGEAVDAPDFGPVVLQYRGATVHSEAKLDATELAYVLDAAAYNAAWHGDLGGIDIVFQRAIPVADGEQVGAVTYARSRTMFLYYPAQTDCLTSTHIAHEMAHWTHFLNTGDPDSAHADPVYWAMGGIVSETYGMNQWYCAAPADLQQWTRQQVQGQKISGSQDSIE